MSNKPIQHRKGRLFKCILGDQKGSILFLIAIMIVVLLGFVGLSIDIGYYMVTRNELQNIADSAALASCRQLGAIYQSLSPENQEFYVCNEIDSNTIKAKAVDVGQKNSAGGLQGIDIELADIIIGTWDGTTFTPDIVDQPDAVKVIVRRDENANDPITPFFAGILGINHFNVSMKATAALTGQSTTEPGELELPVGISSYFFQDGNFCNNFIVFNPTNDPDSCAGWNSYDIDPPNDATLRDILNQDISSPETNVGETEFEFIGGNLSTQTFDALLLLFMDKGYDTLEDGITPAQTYTDEDGQIWPVTGALPDGTEGTVPIDEYGQLLEEGGERAYYPDDKKDPTPRNMHRWETSVVVYGWDTCANPNTTIPIVGYTKIAMTNVKTAPEKKIEGEIMCDFFSNSATRGGGGNFGLKGTIPGLVE